MYKGKRSIIISSPLKSTYEIAETYPSFVSFFKKNSRVLFKNEKQLNVEIHTYLFKIIPTSWQGEGIKERYKTIHFKQTKGIFKGLEAKWFFEEVDGKTKVSITTTFSKPWLTGFGEEWIGKLVVEKVTQGILKELKRKSELINKD